MASCLFSLLLAELIFRVVMPANSMLLDIYAKDQFGNMKMIANEQRHHLTDEFDAEIKINSKGWRDPQEEFENNKIRIIAIGDSFTFGWGVNFDESFVGILKQFLATDKNAELLNYGAAGTGPIDHFNLLNTVLRDQKPDVILYSFFVGNDFYDVQKGGTDRYMIRDGHTISRESTDEDGGIVKKVEFLVKRYSIMAQFLSSRYWVVRDKIKYRWLGKPITHGGIQSKNRDLVEMFQVHLKNSSEEVENSIDETLKYLDKIADFCISNNCKIIFQVIPRSIQIYQGNYNEFVSVFNLKQEDLDLDRPQRVLTVWAEKYSNDVVRLVDMLPLIRSADKNGRARMYFNPNNHWNKEGHKYSSEVLLPVLKQHVEKILKQQEDILEPQ